MELKKESMQILKEKSRAKSQITFDEDFNVPDAKPDAGRLIQNKGRIIMDDVRLTDGKGILTGNLQVDILYVGEESGIVSGLTAKLPFEETLNLKNIINGDKMCLKWEIEDLTIRLIHSRKLNIKALVTFCATVDETEQIRLPVALDAEEVSVRKKTVRFLGLTVHKKDTLRIKDEYTIASNRPDIASLIWYTMDVRGLDLKPEENVVKARGELSVFVLYGGSGAMAGIFAAFFRGSGMSGLHGRTDPADRSFGDASESGGQTGCRWGRTDPCFGCGAGAGYEIFQGRGI